MILQAQFPVNFFLCHTCYLKVKQRSQSLDIESGIDLLQSMLSILSANGPMFNCSFYLKNVNVSHILYSMKVSACFMLNFADINAFQVSIVHTYNVQILYRNQLFTTAETSILYQSEHIQYNLPK